MSDIENQEKMRKYYDEEEYFDESIQNYSDLLKSPFQRYRVAKVLQIYRPNKDEEVLDLGCAMGTFSFALAPLCKKITGVDYSKKAINICNKFLKASPYSNIEFVCAAGENTGLQSESFDVIICADLLEHLYPDISEKILFECARLLRKGGKLVIWTPHRGHILEIMKHYNIILKKDVSHVDFKSMDRLKESLEQKNFNVLNAYYANSHIPLFRIFESFLQNALPVMRRRIAILAQKN